MTHRASGGTSLMFLVLGWAMGWGWSFTLVIAAMPVVVGVALLASTVPGHRRDQRRWQATAAAVARWAERHERRCEAGWGGSRAFTAADRREWALLSSAPPFLVRLPGLAAEGRELCVRADRWPDTAADVDARLNAILDAAAVV